MAAEVQAELGWNIKVDYFQTCIFGDVLFDVVEYWNVFGNALGNYRYVILKFPNI
jgi:hypothetical protein